MSNEFSLEEVYEALKHDVITVLYEWRIYSEWFRADSERIDLLNSVSGSTSLVIQNALFERTIMALCRLTDDHRQGSNLNLSLEALLAFPKTSEDVRLNELVAEAKEGTRTLRRIRSKMLAHTDVERRMSEASSYGVTYHDIDDSLASCGGVIKHYASKYLDTHQLLSALSNLASDEVAFLSVLHSGVRAEEKENEDYGQARTIEAMERLRKEHAKPEWLTSRRFLRLGE